MSTEYVATIGLEVHAQLKTKSKMFCGCRVEYGAEPNRRNRSGALNRSRR